MTTFQRGDIVTCDGSAKEWTVSRVDESDIEIEDASYFKWAWPVNLTLVYRLPTREEVEALRSRVAELEVALMPFADLGCFNDCQYDYDVARKAMGLEG